MRDGVRPNVVCTLPILAYGVWIVWRAGRRERRKRQPAALPRLESDDAYGSASTYICVGPRFREQIPCIGISMARTLAPPAPNHRGTVREGPPRTRALPTNRAEFQVFAGGGEQRHWAGSHQARAALLSPPRIRLRAARVALPSPTWDRLPAQPAAEPSTPKGSAPHRAHP